MRVIEVDPERLCRCELDHLSPHEAELVAMMAGGLSNREIARRLHLSKDTVAHHITSLLQRVNARNSKELIAHAYVSGIVSVAAWPPVTSGRLCLKSRALASTQTGD